MIEMQAGALRAQFDRTLETRDGLLMATSAAQHNADGVPAWRRLRYERERSRDRCQRFVVTVEPGKPACQLRLRLGIARIERAGLTDLREPFGNAATLGRKDAALENRRRPLPGRQARLRDRSGT